MWHIFWRGYSRLRSGREHWAWMVVVEVRQGTLGGDTRGWGPAGNTGRGWSWLRSGREHWAGMVVVEVRQGTLGVDGRGWGPAGNTGRGWSWLRSGREHWAWMVVVEVRQGTLGVDGCGWGPAGNTGRGWSWLRSGRAHWRGWSWLRSGREHCGSRVAVGRGGRGGRRGGGGEEEERRRRGREEEEQATDIKSNNPHLAGGEKHELIMFHNYQVWHISWVHWCPSHQMWLLVVVAQGLLLVTHIPSQGQGQNERWLAKSNLHPFYEMVESRFIYVQYIYIYIYIYILYINTYV